MINIRPFTPADRERVRTICMDTANAKGGYNRIPKKRECVCLLFVDYYLDCEPENVLVAESMADDGSKQICGYMVCSTQPARYLQKYPEYIRRARKLSLLIGTFGKFCLRTSKKLDRLFQGGGFHINIDPNFQGQKIGPKLLTAMGEHLRAQGLPYMYLVTQNQKTRGYAFYNHYGFTIGKKLAFGSLAMIFDLRHLDAKIQKYFPERA